MMERFGNIEKKDSIILEGAGEGGGIPFGVTTGSGSAATVTIDGIDALTTDMIIQIKAHTAFNSTVTLNLNGLGAKTIRRVSANLSLFPINSGQYVYLRYDGTYWQLEDRLYVSQTTTGSRIYGTNAAGVQTFYTISTSHSSNSIPQRKDSGILSMARLSSNPTNTLEDGDMYYDLNTDELKVRINGTFLKVATAADIGDIESLLGEYNMSIASEILRIQQAKQAIKESINNKGGTLTNESIDDYAQAIDNLPSGGGGMTYEDYARTLYLAWGKSNQFATAWQKQIDSKNVIYDIERYTCCS